MIAHLHAHHWVHLPAFQHLAGWGMAALFVIGVVCLIGKALADGLGDGD